MTITYRFGRFELRPATRQLLVDGQPAALGARAFDVLHALVERRDRLVTKNELLYLAWSGLIVEENNLQVQVASLRKILGSDAIATIPGRGYRFSLEMSSEGPVASSTNLANRHNLPRQITSFIGRERELAEAKGLLAGSRLVTLVGVGGIGKTRLSLEVAADAMDDYPDGVWRAELASLTDARLVPQAVASALGVREEAGRPLQEALVKYVRHRRLLLILDNCEHLLHGCAELAKQLLQSGPQLKVLASSRERLRVGGEATYSVPALAFPDRRQTITPAALTRSEAVRLFVERAVAVQHTFEVTDRNATAVADICQRPDGIPLAIELAAARVRALSVVKIAERLSDRFKLLTRGDETALPRQQTLRATMDWSYDLLSEPERGLLRRLAVFAGGWTLEAAEAVGAGGEVHANNVLDLLTHLVEKSLVTLEADGERYSMLETVRQYAQERLSESDDEDQARVRHLAFYLALAEEAERKLLGPNQGAWLLRLDRERENLLSAHTSCDHAQGGASLGLRLVYSVKRYWLNRGLLGLGHRVTMEALMRGGARTCTLGRCLALSVAGQIGYWMGGYEHARGHLEESLAIAREIGDRGQVAAQLRLLGNVSLAEGDGHTARAYLEEAIAIAREVADTRELAGALNGLAELDHRARDLDAAEARYEEAMELAREHGDRGNIAFSLLCLAQVSVERESGDRAAALMLDALAIIDEIRSKPDGQRMLEISAGLAGLRGEWEQAARFYGASDAAGQEMELHRIPRDKTFIPKLVARMRKTLGVDAFAAA